MFSNRISSVFFSSAFALLLGACLLLPNNGYAAVVGDLNCDETLNVQDIIQLVGWMLGTIEPVDCAPPEICDITIDNDAAYADGAASVSPEDGINQSHVDVAYSDGYADGANSVECEECGPQWAAGYEAGSTYLSVTLGVSDDSCTNLAEGWISLADCNSLFGAQYYPSFTQPECIIWTPSSGSTISYTTVNVCD